MKYTASIFKSLETQLIAYRMVFLAVKILDKQQSEILEQSFQQAVNSPELAKQMYEKYDVVLEQVLARVDEASAEEDLLKWIREWKPQNPPN